MRQHGVSDGGQGISSLAVPESDFEDKSACLLRPLRHSRFRCIVHRTRSTAMLPPQKRRSGETALFEIKKAYAEA